MYIRTIHERSVLANKKESGNESVIGYRVIYSRYELASPGVIKSIIIFA